MKNEILDIDGTNYDLNGFEVNSKGGSQYTGVYYDSEKKLYGVTITNDNLSDRDSTGLLISMHEDSREAAFFYEEFVSDITNNVIEFEKCGSRNWTPKKATPNFEYDSLDTKPITGDLSKAQRKSIKNAIKNITIHELYINKNNPLYKQALSNMEVTGQIALDIVMKKVGLTLRNLTKKQKDIIRPFVINKTENALTLCNTLEEKIKNII